MNGNIKPRKYQFNNPKAAIYRFKKPWSDGSTSIKLTPLELIERLVALVPNPRMHLTRFHGVLGPHYKYRSEVVPKTTEEQLLAVACSTPTSGDPSIDRKKPSKQRMSWPRLLKRVFNIDIKTCPQCQGEVNIIAAIEEPAVIIKILKHLGLSTKVPKFHPARGPPHTTESIEFDISVLA